MVFCVKSEPARVAADWRAHGASDGRAGNAALAVLRGVHSQQLLVQRLRGGNPRPRCGGYHTPGILYGYQNKGVAKFAIRNFLILKDVVSVFFPIPPKSTDKKSGSCTEN